MVNLLQSIALSGVWLVVSVAVWGGIIYGSIEAWRVLTDELDKRGGVQ